MSIRDDAIKAAAKALCWPGCDHHTGGPEECDSRAMTAVAAALPVLLHGAAERLQREVCVSRAELEILIPECHKRQCACCHPTGEQAFTLIIGRAVDFLQRMAAEAAGDESR